MIIDEINRANLPKVLGELLFLLEYRNEPVRTLYRPDDPFELPKDLWFIGTMNTADRSIALVDAALRRRFHFVPFFPNHGPMAGLLDRWLERERRAGVGRRAGGQVNDELSEALGGPHLQLGPSHFMKHGLDQRRAAPHLGVQHRAVHRGPVLRRRRTDRQIPLHQVWARFSDLAPESISEEPASDGAGELTTVPVLSEYGSIDLDLTRSQAEAIQRTGFVDVSPGPAGSLARDGRRRTSAHSSWTGSSC